MEKLAILDCGGQYTKVIDRKVRELGVYTDIFPMGVDPAKLAGYGAIIFSGGPASVWRTARRNMTRSCSISAFRCSESATGCR